jgi:hypothetical protein
VREGYTPYGEATGGAGVGAGEIHQPQPPSNRQAFRRSLLDQCNFQALVCTTTTPATYFLCSPTKRRIDATFSPPCLALQFPLEIIRRSTALQTELCFSNWRHLWVLGRAMAGPRMRSMRCLCNRSPQRLISIVAIPAIFKRFV